MSRTMPSRSPVLPESLASRYARTRAQTIELSRLLTAEDTVVQSMPDASPVKWHLAHITWFFEHFVLQAELHNYSAFNDRYHYLFNSYYYSVGSMHARAKRGLLTRPSLADILDYRAHVDDTMAKLIASRDGDTAFGDLVTLGLNHEQQHQELLLTDILHAFSLNPLQPAVNEKLLAPPPGSLAPYGFTNGDTGIHRIGADGAGFCFDNETPQHTALLHEHCLGNRLISNAEFRDFIDAGAYTDSNLWLSDGWAHINQQQWNRPLYWSEDLQTQFTLGGTREIDPQAPVCHVSFYEAEAFARWAGARLPTEFEWERAAARESINGNLLESEFWQPVASDTAQFFGDAWEWTSSAYAPYPGFKPLAGSLGEYNGKFMCNQMTVRGGSCVTASDHIRASYRSFFYPQQRWQFLGFRLAKDGLA